MRRGALVLVTALLTIAVAAGPASSQPPPHDHLLTIPGTGEQVQIGPKRCARGETVQQGFLNFHLNVHLGAPGVTIDAVLC